MLKGTVVIVGRPNVGKSTLFNKMTKSRDAIVGNQPGVTRDRVIGVVEADEYEMRDGFIIVDTGGFETKDFSSQPIKETLVWKQTQIAIVEADIVVLVLDGKDGLNPHDEFLTRYLTSENKKFIVAVNKLDGIEQQVDMCEFYRLGIDTAIALSAAHNRGVGLLIAELAELIADLDIEKNKTRVENADYIAIIGRPNAGKSSILNRLLGEERAVVSSMAGTTRDSIDSPIKYKNKTYMLVDTAGVRRKSKISDRLESLSVIKSLAAIERADIVFLVIDVMQGMTDQDARLANIAVARAKPVLLIFNKWDLYQNKNSNSVKNYQDDVRYAFKTLAFIEMIFVSCLENLRIHQLLEKVPFLLNQSSKRIPTATLNTVLQDVIKSHTPALIRNHTKRVRFYYATQVRATPPTIVIFCNVSDEIQASYKRYMKNSFRIKLGFDNIPFNIIFRNKKDIQGASDIDTLSQLKH